MPPRSHGSSEPRRFICDSLNRLRARNPGRGTITYTYDADGNLDLHTDACGITTDHNCGEPHSPSSATAILAAHPDALGRHTSGSETCINRRTMWQRYATRILECLSDGRTVIFAESEAMITEPRQCVS